MSISLIIMIIIMNEKEREREMDRIYEEYSSFAMCVCVCVTKNFLIFIIINNIMCLIHRNISFVVEQIFIIFSDDNVYDDSYDDDYGNIMNQSNDDNNF